MSDETIRALVLRVMKDGNMNKFEACNFVATMIPGMIGFTVLSKFEKY